MTVHVKELDRNISWDKTTNKWKVKVARGGTVHHLGRFTDRTTARAARDAFLTTQPLAPRQSASDERLRAQALSTARVQFTAATPDELLKAADQLYAWLKQGSTAPRVTEEGTYDRIQAMVRKGVHLWDACEKAGVEPCDYSELQQRVLQIRYA